MKIFQIRCLHVLITDDYLTYINVSKLFVNSFVPIKFASMT